MFRSILILFLNIFLDFTDFCFCLYSYIYIACGKQSKFITSEYVQLLNVFCYDMIFSDFCDFLSLFIAAVAI